MWDFSIGRALKMMLRTLPFIVLRIVVYVGVTLGYMLMTGIGAGVGYGVGAVGGEGARAGGAMWGGFIGFGLFGLFMYWVREYILYLVKAGHIAVLVKLVDNEPMPQGQSQIGYASTAVKARFAESSVLFAVDQLVKGVVTAITGMVRGMLTILPLPGVQQLASILHAFLRVALGFMDELILARMIRTGAGNPWHSAKESVILYGQNYKIMLKNAAWLAAIIYLLSFLVFLIMLAPAGLIVYLMPGAWSAAAVIFALLLAWSIKAALLEPFAISCMMQVYFNAVDGQQPDPEWEARLEQMSKKFRKLKNKAATAVSGGGRKPEDAEPAQ